MGLEKAALFSGQVCRAAHFLPQPGGIAVSGIQGLNKHSLTGGKALEMKRKSLCRSGILNLFGAVMVRVDGHGQGRGDLFRIMVEQAPQTPGIILCDNVIFSLFQKRIPQLMQHGVSVVGGLWDAVYGLETESSVKGFGSRTFFFENIGKYPVGKGVGQADAVHIALDNVGSFRKEIMGIVSGGWTGTPFRKMDFYVWEGTVFHQVPDPGKIHKCGPETAGAAACHRRAVRGSLSVQGKVCGIGMGREKVQGKLIFPAEIQKFFQPDPFPFQALEIFGFKGQMAGDILRLSGKTVIRNEIAGGGTAYAQGGVQVFYGFCGYCVELEIL